MSISHTTRAKRKGEEDGIDYHFVDRDTFTRMRDKGAFLEWAVVFDNYYGTTRKPVEEALAQGRDVLFDVDWQGAASLREKARGCGHRLHPAADGGRSRTAPEYPRAGSARDGAAPDARREQRDPALEGLRLRRHQLRHRAVGGGGAAILAAERLRRKRLTGLKDFVQSLQSKL